MARPKSSKSKGKDDAAAAQNLAADALLCFPADREKLKEEFIDTPAVLLADKESIAAEMASARAAIKEHRKRQTKLYNCDNKTQDIIDAYLALPDGRRQRVIRQVAFLVKQLGLDDQLDLFNDTAAAGGAEPDQGSVFDSTGSGDKMAAERLDDPGRASKRRGPPAPPATATPNVGVEGLAAGIKPLESPEEKRARIDSQKSADAAVFDKVPAKDAAKPNSPAAKVESMDADTKNMTPAQKRAHAKKIADEVFARQGNNGLGPDAVH